MVQLLTSGQHDVQIHKLTPYSELPKKITGPTVWKASEFSDPEKWLTTWSEIEISQIEECANKWKESGRGLDEIQKVSGLAD